MSTVLVPIFFVLIGKKVCGLAVLERSVNRVAVGLGMIPRGEDWPDICQYRSNVDVAFGNGS